MKIRHGRINPDFGRLSSREALLRYRTRAVLREVEDERHAQDARWGEQDWPDGTTHTVRGAAEFYKRQNDELAQQGALTFMDILREEFLEAMSEENPERIREELIQVAAVAVLWIEAIDRRSA